MSPKGHSSDKAPLSVTSCSILIDAHHNSLVRPKQANIIQVEVIILSAAYATIISTDLQCLIAFAYRHGVINIRTIKTGTRGTWGALGDDAGICVATDRGDSSDGVLWWGAIWRAPRILLEVVDLASILSITLDSGHRE